MLNDVSTWGMPLTMFLTSIGLVWSMAWWLSGKLSENKKLMFDRLEKMQDIILSKMDYHEKHDDQRFHDMWNDIWTIKVRNAAIDGLTRVENKTNINT